MHRPLLACVAAGALLLGACGDDDAADDRDGEYADALAVSMAEDDQLPFDADDRDCLSAEFVEALGGADRLAAEGIEPADLRAADGLDDLAVELGDEEAEGIAEAFGDCDVSLARLVLEGTDEELPDDVRDCIEDQEDALADFFARVLVDDTATQRPPDELLEPILGCFPEGS